MRGLRRTGRRSRVLRAKLLKGALAVALLTAALATRALAAGAPEPMSDIDAEERAGGNRKEAAYAIGRAIFATTWPAQVLRVRVDGAGGHEVAGLVISGVKFHRALSAADFTDEVVHLVGLVFAHSAVEEVDVWTTVPVKPGGHATVTGDFAQPTTRLVYTATVRRSEASAGERLRSGRDVYWAPDWKASLRGPAAGGANPNPANSNHSCLLEN